MRKFLFPCIALLAFCADASGKTEVIIPDGYSKVVFQDEFDTDGMPDNGKWGYEQGYVRNGELQYYAAARKENTYIKNGNLHIVARNDSAAIDGEVENFIPATDVRGKASNGKKDIGAFEYNGLNAGVETITTGDNSNIAFISNSSEIVVTNSKGEDMAVAAYSVDGKLLYNAHGVNVTIGKDNLAKGLVIVKATDNNGSATKKIVVM